jgi:eukaryotic-like serine/threonine-protein kinase
VASGRELYTVRDAGKIGLMGLAYSPDGRVIATGIMRGGHIQLWDAATGRPASRIPNAGGRWSLAFAPDGRRLASVAEDLTIKICDAAVGAEALTLSALDATAWEMAFSPDGTHLAAACHDGTVRIWDATPLGDAADPRPLRTLRDSEEDITCLAFRPDGRQVASGDFAGVLRIWDTATGRVIHTIRAHAGMINDVNYSPDSRFVLTNGFSEQIFKVWDATTGQAVRTLLRDAGMSRGGVYSPDGRTVAVSVEREDQPTEVRILDATTGRQLRGLRGHADSAKTVAFSPDGARLAGACVDGTARVWDTATGREIFVLRHAGAVEGVVFSPDGTRLTTGGWTGPCASGTRPLAASSWSSAGMPRQLPPWP